MSEQTETVIHHDVDADGISLHIAECGSGPPIAWLHGSGPGATGLGNFASNLPAFSGYRNLVFDLPRYGRSDAPEINEPLATYGAGKVRHALRKLGVERTHIIGNSFGGQIAIRIAAEHPEMVERVVSMGGSARPPGPMALDEFPSGLQHLFAFMSEPAPTREGIEAFVRAMVVDQSLVTDELIDRRLRQSLKTHPEIQSVPPNQGDLKAVLAQVEAPTLLLWGREDRFIPLEWALVTLRGIPNATLVVLPDCGHWVQVEAKDRFESIVSDFLAEA